MWVWEWKWLIELCVKGNDNSSLAYDASVTIILWNWIQADKNEFD